MHDLTQALITQYPTKAELTDAERKHLGDLPEAVKAAVTDDIARFLVYLSQIAGAMRSEEATKAQSGLATKVGAIQRPVLN